MEYEPVEPQPEQEQPSTALKVAVLVALLILLIVGILLPIKLVPNAFSNFGTKISDFFGAHKRIILTTNPSEINSGSPFTLSWSGDHQTNGVYVLSYSCVDRAQLVTSLNQSQSPINCNSPFYFSPGDNSIPLIAYGDIGPTQVPTSISFLPSGAQQPQTVGSITLTINATTTLPINNSPSPSSNHISTPTPRPTQSQTTSPSPYPSQTVESSGQTQVSNQNGIADLAAYLVSTGYIDPATNTFVPTQQVPSSARAAIRFNVKNIGTKSTGPWSFTASLPSITDPIFNSGTRASLSPGSGVVYTLSFDSLRNQGANPITVTLDPNNLVRESSKANNTLSATIYSY